MRLRSLCVFCGSSPGFDPVYVEAACELGRAMALAGVGLVYGGASVGLMGAMADAVLAHGGEVTGVIPETLVKREVAHHGLTDLRVVGSMHARKALMAELSEGFIALPGGIGTFEELFEIWTWAQLGDHGKPCGIYNVAGFYNGLLEFLDHVVDQGFLKSEHRKMMIVSETASDLLSALEAFKPSFTGKWLNSDEI